MERYRIGSDGAVYFVTYSVVEWLPIFISESACDIIAKSLTFCHANKGLQISAFVIMPTHFHAIVFDQNYDSETLQNTMADFRKFTGRNLSDYCDRRMPKCFSDTLRDAAIADRDRRLWQPSRHPEVIESEWFWKQKLDYLHDNPCRKGLVRKAVHWRYSSAAYLLSDGREPSEVPLSAILW